MSQQATKSRALTRTSGKVRKQRERRDARLTRRREREAGLRRLAVS